MQPAKFFIVEQSTVTCLLCPHHCVIPDGKTGACQVRLNCDGQLFTLNYAECTASALDPIEKKPLYHFYPGTNILSLGTWGCNFQCQFCQNWQISQQQPHTHRLAPSEAVKLAFSLRDQGNIGIAYTYSEPSIWYEYICDTAPLVSQAGMVNVMVTNGYINSQPLAELLPYIDAMNIDVKAFNDTFYRKVCHGSLQTVIANVEQAAKACHVEITTLIIPGYNDSPEEIEQLTSWLGGVNTEIPIHFTRYYPSFKFRVEHTDVNILNRCAEIARRHLKYVYIGNVTGDTAKTYCPECGVVVLDRIYRHNRLKDNCCPACQCEINIKGEVNF